MRFSMKLSASECIKRIREYSNLIERELKVKRKDIHFILTLTSICSCFR